MSVTAALKKVNGVNLGSH